MARRKTGDKKVAGKKSRTASGEVNSVQADDHSIAFEELHIGGDVGGDIRIGHTIGYTAEQVSVLLKQITTALEPKKFDGRCPYKGLEVFEEEDAELFFGRKRLVDDLIGRVKESRTVFITGPSGSGKSSLVRAGLIHTLKNGAIKNSDRWLYETMKPGREPLKDLALAFSRLKSPELEDYFLAHVGETEILNKCAESVLSSRKDQRFVLFIDQFEEVFTQINGEEERVAFINMLAHAGTIENGRVTVLFAMRSDFVSNCATYPALNEMLSQEFRQIGAMQPDELVSAIALPAMHVGLPVENELIAQIINDMRGEPDALPLMQFALKDLFDAKQAEGGVVALTLKDYLQHGGIHKSLERHADATFAKLSESEQELTRSIFSGLIEIGRGTQDTKRTALFDELIPANTKAEDVGAIIQKLADARLIITDEQAGKDTVTISHEKLIEAWPWLKKLVNENRETIALQNEIASDAKEWDDHKRDPSYLYSGARLASAHEQLEAKKLILSGLAHEFVQRGSARKSRNRIILIGAISSIIALLVMAVIVFRTQADVSTQLAQRNAEVAGTAQANADEAQKQAHIAHAGELVAQSIAMREQNFQTSLLLGIEAFRYWNSVQSRGALLDGIKTNSQLRQFLTKHANSVLSIAFGQDGKTLASSSCGKMDNENCTQGEIILWDVTTGLPIGEPLKAHTSWVPSVAFSPDGKILASGSCGLSDTCSQGEIILWDVKMRQPIGIPLRGHTTSISILAFSPDGKLLVSGSGPQDRVVILWDVSSHQPVGELPTGAVFNSVGVAFSPDGKMIASGSDDGKIILWDVATRQPIGQSFTFDSDWVAELGFSPHGKTLAARGITLGYLKFIYNVTLWDVGTGQFIRRLDSYTPPSIAFSPDGEELAYDDCQRFDSDGFCIQGKIVFLDYTGELQIRPPFVGHTSSISTLAFSPDGKMIASGGGDHNIILWNMETTQLLSHSLTKNSFSVSSLAFSPNGKTIASGGDDHMIGLWNIETGQQIGQPHNGHNSSVSSLAFSLDGMTLASGGCRMVSGSCAQGEIILWDSTTGQPIGEPLIGHSSPVASLAFGPDDKTLASGSTGNDGTFILWNLETHQPIIKALGSHINSINSMAFSPDGKTLALGTDDHTIILWNVKTGQPIGEPLLGVNSHFSSVAFSRDGETLASVSCEDLGSNNECSQNEIILWDMATRQPIGQLPAESIEQANSIAFSPDGKFLASGSPDGSITLWDVDPQSWIQKTCQRVGRNLTRAEWNQYFPNEEYRKSCEQWPLEPEFVATPSPIP